MNVIEINNLSKYYGKARGIIDVSFSIKEGEIFGFVGPNGAGKSTTIRTLLSFIYPSGGNAKILGMDCFKDTQKIKREIGYLPSEVNYYDDMKVKELLYYSAKFYRKDCSKRIYELSEIFELDLNKRIDALSFGNKKKLAIVQSLLHEPKVLILDEPTGGLDPHMQNKFFEVLKEENRKGTTIFFSSHILSEVQKMCDRVAIIKEGKILKVEHIDELRANKYKKIKMELKDPSVVKNFQVPGIMNYISSNGKGCQFLFNGKVDHMIRELAKHDVDNLWIEEPSLEEVFMHYYEKEEE